MALAFVIVKKESIPYTENSVRGWVDITLDDSYVDLGWPVLPSDLGINSIVGFVPPAISAGGLVFGWDHVNNKILAYEQTADGLVSIVTVSADDINEGDVIRCYFEGA